LEQRLHVGRDGHAVRRAAVSVRPEAARSGCGRSSVNEDPHLRSIEEITGYHIHATDGEIGHVEDFLVDDAGWGIRYVAVDTRNWWPGKKVLISPRSVQKIDWANRLLHLDVDRQKVKDSQAYDATMTVDRTYEERFHDHYGGDWPGI
jgi:hypothetical protein